MQLEMKLYARLVGERREEAVPAIMAPDECAAQHLKVGLLRARQALERVPVDWRHCSSILVDFNPRHHHRRLAGNGERSKSRP
jgi:hypothetical protein